MKFLLNIYDRFLTWLNLQRISPQNSKQSKSDEGSLSFHFKNNDSILVLMNIPSISDTNPDNIVEISEKYASFLVHVSNGLMQDEVVGLLNSALDQTDDLNKQLFLRNTLYFLPILENELKKSLYHKYINNMPMIRPIHVFNNQSK